MHIEPAIMQSAFTLKNGQKIIVFTGTQGNNAISSWICDNNWNPVKEFANCPKSTWTYVTQAEYHQNIRDQHGAEALCVEHSTNLAPAEADTEPERGIVIAQGGYKADVEGGRQQSAEEILVKHVSKAIGLTDVSYKNIEEMKKQPEFAVTIAAMLEYATLSTPSTMEQSAATSNAKLLEYTYPDPPEYYSQSEKSAWLSGHEKGWFVRHKAESAAAPEEGEETEEARKEVLKVIQNRIDFFKSIRYHTHEERELNVACDILTRLIPPSDWDRLTRKP